MTDRADINPQRVDFSEILGGCMACNRPRRDGSTGRSLEPHFRVAEIGVSSMRIRLCVDCLPILADACVSQQAALASTQQPNGDPEP